jgi:hypothetical protein
MAFCFMPGAGHHNQSGAGCAGTMYAISSMPMQFLGLKAIILHFKCPCGKKTFIIYKTA